MSKEQSKLGCDFGLNNYGWSIYINTYREKEESSYCKMLNKHIYMKVCPCKKKIAYENWDL